jgi:tRNA threonylcarbamoyl adenosine modification protein YeaZ
VLVLALDTATPTLVAGLARWSPDGATEVLAERAVPSGNRHAELLTVAVTEVLRDAGLALADVDAVVTGLGPGPFTGLRVGVVTATALGDARGLPVVGVCSLDAVGSGARTVVTDARRKEVYWAAYGTDGTRTDGPGVARPEELTVAGPVLGGRPVRRAARRGGHPGRGHDDGAGARRGGRSWPTRRPPRPWRPCTCAARTPSRRRRSSR